MLCSARFWKNALPWTLTEQRLLLSYSRVAVDFSGSREPLSLTEQPASLSADRPQEREAAAAVSAAQPGGAGCGLSVASPPSIWLRHHLNLVVLSARLDFWLRVSLLRILRTRSVPDPSAFSQGHLCALNL